METITRKVAGTPVRMTSEQAAVLSVLEDAKAGFVTLHNYVQDGRDWIKPRISTVTVNGGVNPGKVYANRVKALESIVLEDVATLLEDWQPHQGRANKNNRDTLAEQFEHCKALLLDTCNGGGGESHKKAHQNHSVSPAPGIKVWLHDDADADGVRTVKSILVNALPVSKTIHDAGEHKPSKPGSKVQVDNAIAKVWNDRACNLKTFNPLKAERVSISGMVIA